jgi:hypothetical protein
MAKACKFVDIASNVLPLWIVIKKWKMDSYFKHKCTYIIYTKQNFVLCNQEIYDYKS